MRTRLATNTHVALATVGILLGAALASLLHAARPLPTVVWTNTDDVKAAEDARNPDEFAPVPVFLTPGGPRSTLMLWYVGGWIRDGPDGSPTRLARCGGVSRRPLPGWQLTLERLLGPHSERDSSRG